MSSPGRRMANMVTLVFVLNNGHRNEHPRISVLDHQVELALLGFEPGSRRMPVVGGKPVYSQLRILFVATGLVQERDPGTCLAVEEGARLHEELRQANLLQKSDVVLRVASVYEAADIDDTLPDV